MSRTSIWLQHCSFTSNMMATGVSLVGNSAPKWKLCWSAIFSQGCSLRHGYAYRGLKSEMTIGSLLHFKNWWRMHMVSSTASKSVGFCYSEHGEMFLHDRRTAF